MDLALTGAFEDCYDEFDVAEDFVLGADNAWSVTVPFGTDLSELDITGTLSEGAEMVPDFDALGTFVDGIAKEVTVTAFNAISTQVYTITVNVGPASSEHLLL